MNMLFSNSSQRNHPGSPIARRSTMHSTSENFSSNRTVDSSLSNDISVLTLNTNMIDTVVDSAQHYASVLRQSSGIRSGVSSPICGSPKIDNTNVLNSHLSPPLPLMKFKSHVSKLLEPPKTINGEVLPYIVNRIPTKFDASSSQKNDSLFDPLMSRKLSKYFIARAHKELNYKQSLSYPSSGTFINDKLNDTTANSSNAENGLRGSTPPVVIPVEVYDYTVYESNLHIESKRERTKKNEERQSEASFHLERYQASQSDNTVSNTKQATNADRNQLPPLHRMNSQGTVVSDLNSQSGPSYTKSLQFDGEFESGNLEKAVRVFGRETLLSNAVNNDLVTPSEVHQEYDLYTRKDIHTDGNIQWYYFKVTTMEDVFSTCSEKVTYPLTVRFNIVNMQKSDSLYNYGMRPAVYSVSNAQLLNEDWIHSGEDVCYYRNGSTVVKAPANENSKKKSVLQYQYTLTFTYTFTTPDTVYFAHTFPYTYSDLQSYLARLEADVRIASIMHRKLLCKSLVGNNCDIISITERCNGVIESKIKPSIIISARVHPGEANSSYMMHGLIEFLTSDCSEALKLRKSFIFNIIPMLNPDGVIHGNYRCSLAGTDLNRRYADTHPTLHPTITALKQFVKSTQQHRNVLLYLDLHGHSKLKNCFVYGCDITLQSEKITKVLLPLMTEEEVIARRVFARTFPKVLCTVSKTLGNHNFSYRDCAFRVDKSKAGTGRVVSWKQLGIPASYTIEVSFCGNGDNREAKIIKKLGTGATNNNATTSATGTVGTRNNSNNISSLEIPPPMRSPRIKSPRSQQGMSSFKTTSRDEDQYIIDEVSQRQQGIARQTKEQPTHQSVDSTLNDLIESYRTAKHYTKHDLMTLGYELGIAIYHYTNLTHSSLENELNIATTLDFEEKEKTRLQRSNTSANLHTSHSGSSNSAKQPAFRRASTQMNMTGNNATMDSHAPLILERSPIRQRRLDNALQSDSPTNSEQASTQTLSQKVQKQHSYNNLNGSTITTKHILIATTDIPIINIDNDTVSAKQQSKKTKKHDNDSSSESSDGDGDGRDKDKNSSNNLTINTTVAIKEPVVNPYDMLLDYSASSVDLMSEVMVHRSIMKASVFSSEALKSLLSNYSKEFTQTDNATMNISMRIKAEYSIRRALNLDGNITTDTTVNSTGTNPSRSAAGAAGEEAEGSVDGSESDPSADNVPANKLLKNMGKFKDTNSLVAALQKEMAKKRKKDDSDRRKRDKKKAKLLSKQEKAIRKALEDAAQAELELKANMAKLAALEAAAVAAEEARLKALHQRAVRRSNSIFQSAPKHAPSYRFAPEERVLAAPVQIKLVNFKDFDSNRKDGSNASYSHTAAQIAAQFQYTNTPMNITTTTNKDGVTTAALQPAPVLITPRRSVGGSASYINEDGELVTIKSELVTIKTPSVTARPKTAGNNSNSSSSSVANNLPTNLNQHFKYKSPTAATSSKVDISLPNAFTAAPTGPINTNIKLSTGSAAPSPRVAAAAPLEQLPPKLSVNMMSSETLPISTTPKYTTPKVRRASTTTTSSSFNVIYNCERPTAQIVTNAISTTVPDTTVTATTPTHAQVTVESQIAPSATPNIAYNPFLNTITQKSKSILYSLPTLDDYVLTTNHITQQTGEEGVSTVSSGISTKFVRPSSASATGRVRKKSSGQL